MPNAYSTFLCVASCHAEKHFYALPVGMDIVLMNLEVSGYMPSTRKTIF